MDGGEDFVGNRSLGFLLEPLGLGRTWTSDASSSTMDLETLLAEHRDLVLEIASHHARPGVDGAALVQAGIEGLLDAATRFDASCGRFVDFAAWWIRRRVTRRASAMA